MKIRPVGAELFHSDGRTDTHDKSKSRFSQFANAPKKNVFLNNFRYNLYNFSK